jgi:hypothetical protein
MPASKDQFSDKLQDLRLRLMEDLPTAELEKMQLKVDTLMRLAMLDGEHDHDSGGGTGHHDHESLADLTWRIDAPRRMIDVENKKL